MQEEILDEIINEVEKLDELEQKMLLASLRVKQLQKKRTVPAANPPAGLEPLSMEEINYYTHEARKQNANQ